MNTGLFKKIIFRMFLVVFALCFVMGGIAFAKYYVAVPNREILTDALDPVTPDRTNILLLATDESGLRTDTMMVASLDSVRKQVNLVSIPRDTRVKMDGYYEKINAAYAFGEEGKREQNSLKYVKELTGLSIQYYAVIRPKGFRDIIDTLGGVYFDVPQRMYYTDPYQDLYIDLQPGYQLLDGDKAEQFTRYRNYLEGDLDRVRAQQKFLTALFEQKLKPEYILKSKEMYVKLSESIDTNIKISDFPVFIKMLDSLNTESIRTFELPGADGMLNGTSYFFCDIDKTRTLIETEFLGKTAQTSSPIPTGSTTQR